MNRRVISILILLFSLHGYAQTSVNLLFVGDAMQHQSQIDAGKRDKGRSFDYSSYFKYVEDRITSADLSVVNLESPLGGKPYSGYPVFCAPDAFAQTLKDVGFDIFLTANNHILDKRKRGLERTTYVLDSLGITHTGTFPNAECREENYPLIVKKNDIRMAMLNYTYGTNGIEVQAPNVVNFIDTVQIKKDIQVAKDSGVDLIVANMHWGIEYKLKHNRQQTHIANFLIRNGVRLVIGNHPHVVQPVDIRREGDSITSIVVYSLGNLISNMRTVDTRGGMMAYIKVSKDEQGQIEIDSFDYSLVWTHKIKNSAGVITDYELLPVESHEGEEGKKYLSSLNYTRLTSFATHAKTAIESLWEK